MMNIGDNIVERTSARYVRKLERLKRTEVRSTDAEHP